MNSSSRRSFLGASLALPALASASANTGAANQAPAKPVQAAASPRLTWGTLGKTGMRVTRLSFGCMTTSDQSVIERAADMGIKHFDTARVYQGGNNERMVGAALKARRKQVFIASKSLAMWFRLSGDNESGSLPDQLALAALSDLPDLPDLPGHLGRSGL